MVEAPFTAHSPARAGLATRRQLLAVAAWPWATPAQALGARDALLLQADAPPSVLARSQPATGGLNRLLSRRGAWYGLLYLPLSPLWPVSLTVWPQPRRHALRLYALDRAPDAAPTLSWSLALQEEPSPREPGGKVWVSRFMLPADSTADGAFVLVEQWRQEGSPPPPLWLWLRSLATQYPEDASWRTAPPGERRVEAPPSPLTQQLREQGGAVLPIHGQAPAWPKP